MHVNKFQGETGKYARPPNITQGCRGGPEEEGEALPCEVPEPVSRQQTEEAGGVAGEKHQAPDGWRGGSEGLCFSKQRQSRLVQSHWEFSSQTQNWPNNRSICITWSLKHSVYAMNKTNIIT